MSITSTHEVNKSLQGVRLCASLGYITQICNGKMTNKSDAGLRLPGTLGSSIFAALHGVDILRVHDVDEHNDMLNVYQNLTD